MKRIILLFALTALCVACSRDDSETVPYNRAEDEKWVANDMVPRFLNGNAGVTQLKTIRTDEGKIILTWIRPEGDYTSPFFSSKLHLQVFNADGSAVFSPEGIIVSEKPTMTYNTDYSVALASDGDILIAYWDVRDDNIQKERNEIYLYRYKQSGAPVWSRDGVHFEIEGMNDMAYAASPTICVSAGNIYVGAYFYDDASHNYQINRIDENGAPVWDRNLKLNAKGVVMYPCEDGDAYAVYGNGSLGYEAVRLKADGTNAWSFPIPVESMAVGDSLYMKVPGVAVDGNGGLFLSYRVIFGSAGYQAINHLSADGTTMPMSVNCNGIYGGDAGRFCIAARDSSALVAWAHKVDPSGTRGDLSVKMFKADGTALWSDAVSICENEEWGVTPVAVIPRQDGWIILYGEGVTWNAARFNAQKLDNDGNTVWTRQLGSDMMLSSGFSVEYDADHAYIFYCYEDMSSDKGGMNVFCISL